MAARQALEATFGRGTRDQARDAGDDPRHARVGGLPQLDAHLAAFGQGVRVQARQCLPR